MSRNAPPLLARSFLPTWFALAAIFALQMVILVIQDEPVAARERAWSFDASALVVVTVITGTGAWAFPKVRAAMWLIGAMCVALLSTIHASGTPPPPNTELLAFYAVGAVLLAIGAWERARIG